MTPSVSARADGTAPVIISDVGYPLATRRPVLDRASRVLGGLTVYRRAKRRAQIHRALINEVFPILAECVLVIRVQTESLRRAARLRR